MCKPGGEPKQFQTKLLALAKIKAEKESRRLGVKIRPYFCYHCRNYCLTSKKDTYRKKNSKKRRKHALRPQICVWEGEGGSYGD